MSALMHARSVGRRSDPAPVIAGAAAIVGVLCVIGVVAFDTGKVLPVATAIGIAVFATVVARPVVGLYLVLAVTPLLAGIDRGAVVPALRPSEAVAGLVVAAIVTRAIWIGIARGWRRPELGSLDVAVVLLAVAGSFIPVVWLAARARPIEADDVLYGLTMWKFVALFALARSAVTTEREIAWCLRISLAVAATVAVIGIMQALFVPGVTSFLSTYYAPYGNVQSVLNGRGGSTLSLPVAAADLLTFNIAIAIGYLHRAGSRRSSFGLISLIVLLLIGVMAAGEFSGMLGAVVGLIVASLLVRRGRVLAYAMPALLIGSFALRSVIATRLEGFRSVSGLPVSWSGRIHNLTTYFWPQLSSGNQFLLGVRPAARVPVASQATGYVWIESGYMWLLWSGGIPLLLAFLGFVVAGVRRGLALLRGRGGPVAVVGLACTVALIVVAALMP
ncbi:MAG TPA: hypothetical protein VLA82_07775, partial [Actinomycetota bacterium]|nr:hypothetical protein [Actinomycetota bacterium]